MKKRAAFVDHSFHKFTQSSVFLKKWLSERYLLDEYYDDSWQGGEEPPLEEITAGGYAVVFYVQFLPSPRDLKKIKGKNIVWFPMEGVFAGRRNLAFLLQLTKIPIKIVCFSKTAYERLRSYGFDCFYIQYFFNPEALPRKDSYNRLPRVMFWQRNNDINWSLVKQVIGNNQIKDVMLRLIPDPGQKVAPPVPDDVVKYRIRIENSRSDIDEYRRELSVFDIFFAPRRFEGIGMSFLEAMAMGLCTVAPDSPTMNEYIHPGENGFLYDPENPRELNLADYEKMGREAKKTSAAGYLTMEERRTELMNFVNSNCRKPSFLAKIKGIFRLFRTIF